MPNFGGNIIMHVSADPATGTLIVNGNAGGYTTQVNRTALVQTIEWVLQPGAGQSGAFDPLGSDPATSGFSWTTANAPSPTIFSGYAEHDGDRITVNDMNGSVASQGEWTYRLRATVNGKPCQTNPPGTAARLKDPRIRNR